MLDIACNFSMLKMYAPRIFEYLQQLCETMAMSMSNADNVDKYPWEIFVKKPICS